jgi:hypothetical protein
MAHITQLPWVVAEDHRRVARQRNRKEAGSSLYEASTESRRPQLLR